MILHTGLKALDEWAKGFENFPSRLAIRNKMDELLVQEPKMLRLGMRPKSAEYAAWLADGAGIFEELGQKEAAAAFRRALAKAKEMGIC